jgi:hypothetical protein
VTKDWSAWHDSYEDPTSALSRRLAVVQAEIRRVLPTRATDSFTVVSVCAGQGDDLIGALAGHPSVTHVKGRLVELDERNVERLQAKLEGAGLDGLDVVHGDAADTALYAGVLPADLVLLCGVLGNVSDSDVMRTVAAMPQFCKRGATVIWTRSRREPDLTPAIRSGFVAAGFTQTAFVAPEDVLFSVGACRFDGQPQTLQQERLFRFVG